MRSRSGPVLRRTILLLAVTASGATAQSLSMPTPPAPLHITTTTGGPGTGLQSVSDNTAQYRTRTTNGNGPTKIMGRVSGLPAGLTLQVSWASNTGLTPNGTVTLATTDQLVVSQITTTSNVTGQITYTLSATPAAGVVSGTATVTYTVLNWP